MKFDIIFDLKREDSADQGFLKGIYAVVTTFPVLEGAVQLMRPIILATLFNHLSDRENRPLLGGMNPTILVYRL